MFTEHHCSLKFSPENSEAGEGMCRSPEVPNAEFCPGLDFSVIQTRTSHKSRAGKLLHQSQNAWAWLVDDPTRRDRVKLTGEVDSSVAAQIDYTR